MSDQMFEKCLMLKDREKSVETIINAMHYYTKGFVRAYKRLTLYSFFACDVLEMH